MDASMLAVFDLDHWSRPLQLQDLHEVDYCLMEPTLLITFLLRYHLVSFNAPKTFTATREEKCKVFVCSFAPFTSHCERRRMEPDNDEPSLQTQTALNHFAQDKHNMLEEQGDEAGVCLLANRVETDAVIRLVKNRVL